VVDTDGNHHPRLLRSVVTTEPESAAASNSVTPLGGLQPAVPSRRPTRFVVTSDDEGLVEDYLSFVDTVRSRGDLDDQNSATQLVTEDQLQQQDLLKSCRIKEVVFFLRPRVSTRVLKVFAQIARQANGEQISCVVVLLSLGVHFGDRASAEFECFLCDSLKQHVSRLTVIRTGHVLSSLSRTSLRLREMDVFSPLIHDRMTSTFVDGERLFRTIEAELISADALRRPQLASFGSGFRELTLLGTRRSWRSVIPKRLNPGRLPRITRRLSSLLSAFGFSWILLQLLRFCQYFIPSLRQISFHTLKPRSYRELISLYTSHNCGDVVIAGYNNGVNHFGWDFPDRTVVLTTSIPGRTRIQTVESPGRSPARILRADAGLTLNHCIRALKRAGLEFFVVPNYSWISMGTLFFVPIHGSGSRISTLGDTIDEVLLYDGDHDQFIRARRGDLLFRESMYSKNRHLLLLRMKLSVKPQSQYFVKRFKLQNPSAQEILDLFVDSEACNVEVRRSTASSDFVEVSKYYSDVSQGDQRLLEVPRDKIGQIWDRLEQTPVVSTLFHWFVRTFGFHVELFLTPEEFSVFWGQIGTLPISKIQLRRVLKDGIPNSACETGDRISADLFMTRRNRDGFCRFIAGHLPGVRTNPGKQSL
jgi:hypothetical protein